MRVIAGSARSIKLKTLPSDATRPTTDKIKETLFNMLQRDIYDSCFLDLFSGSGAIGIEALSRGAKKAYFIENNRNAIACINDNLRSTKLAGKAQVRHQDVLRFLEKKEIEGISSFDLIFMDPPYNMHLEEFALKLLSNASYVSDDTRIIVESSARTDFSYLDKYGFQIVKVKEYKTNKHVFIQRI